MIPEKNNDFNAPNRPPTDNSENFNNKMEALAIKLERDLNLFKEQCAVDEEDDARFESSLADLQDLQARNARQIRKLEDSNNTPLVRLAIFIAKMVEFIFNAIVYIILNGASFGGKIIAKPFQYSYALVANTRIE